MSQTLEKTANGQVLSTTYTGGTDQATIELAFHAQGYAVQLTPTGGSAKIQASLDGTNWEDWPAGLVAVTTISALFLAHYIRVVHTSATSSSLVIWGV